MDYWRECIEAALEEAGLAATNEQIELMAGVVEGAHENCGMAFGHHAIPNPLASEKERLAKELEHEKRKVHCEECGGRGRIITYGPYHSGDSECWKCRGDGRHDP